MTMITPSYLGETIEYSSLHACRSTLEDPTRKQPRNTICLGTVAAVFVLPSRESHSALSELALVGTNEQASAEKDPLVTLNNSFRVAYAKARKEALAKVGPVILVEGDDITLLRDGKHTRVQVIPEIYHLLKDVAHVPFALFVMLEPEGQGKIAESRLAELKGYREQIAAAKESLGKRGFDAEQLKRQLQIFSAATQLLDNVLAKKQVDNTELNNFARLMGPLVLANADEATKAQLDSMHKQIKEWRAQLTPDEWQNLHVLIQGSHMPRQGHAARQYFARLLGEKGEGARIIYAEALFDEERALNLLGNYLVDVPAGIAFFDDPLRLARDLLSDAATAYIKKMKFD